MARKSRRFSSIYDRHVRRAVEVANNRDFEAAIVAARAAWENAHPDYAIGSPAKVPESSKMPLGLPVGDHVAYPARLQEEMQGARWEREDGVQAAVTDWLVMLDDLCLAWWPTEFFPWRLDRSNRHPAARFVSGFLIWELRSVRRAFDEWLDNGKTLLSSESDDEMEEAATDWVLGSWFPSWNLGVSVEECWRNPLDDFDNPSVRGFRAWAVAMLDGLDTAVENGQITPELRQTLKTASDRARNESVRDAYNEQRREPCRLVLQIMTGAEMQDVRDILPRISDWCAKQRALEDGRLATERVHRRSDRAVARLIGRSRTLVKSRRRPAAGTI